MAYMCMDIFVRDVPLVCHSLARNDYEGVVDFWLTFVLTKCCQKVMERLLVDLSDSHKLRPLLPSATFSLQRVVGPQTSDERISRLLE